jgi:hypothetical protein
MQQSETSTGSAMLRPTIFTCTNIEEVVNGYDLTKPQINRQYVFAADRKSCLAISYLSTETHSLDP